MIDFDAMQAIAVYGLYLCCFGLIGYLRELIVTISVLLSVTSQPRAIALNDLI